VSGAHGDPERARREIPQGPYTQINILFPASSIELPSADKFKEFPPEAQQAILAAFRIEQTHRHQWLGQQQANDHALNILRQKHAFWTRMVGIIAGVFLVATALGFSVWLIQMGQAIWGVAILIASVAGLIGTAIYGHKARFVPTQEPGSDQPPTAPQLAPKP
jgi:uncharacterized membrane protein